VTNHVPGEVYRQEADASGGRNESGGSEGGSVRGAVEGELDGYLVLPEIHRA
jgi:hypothetical protein